VQGAEEADRPSPRLRLGLHAVEEDLRLADGWGDEVDVSVKPLEQGAPNLADLVDRGELV
jgi:hypothetical protein